MRNLLTILLGAVLLGSCKNEHSASVPEAGEAPVNVAGWPATKTTDGGGFAVTVKPVEGEIVQNKHFSIDLTVAPKNSDGGPLTVKVDADMPAHQHGMNTQPELVATGVRHYQVDGMLFHMAGEWVIMVDITRDGKTERASFPVEVN